MGSSFPEAARDRDLRRYYQPWLDGQNLIRSADGQGKGLTYDGYRPQSPRDKALTAFAQLAALRLNVRRAMVSLIDADRQYIIAEATKTLSLYSYTTDRPDDEVWLGNTIIARNDAVCHNTLYSTYTAREENGDPFTADCFVVPDCREDPRFADKSYVKGEPGVRFYAGVPIITKAGYRIGVYAVSDDKPRAGLTATEVRFMRDVASTVMEHLELAKDSDDRSKGERMIRGLTDFIERSSLQEARTKTVGGGSSSSSKPSTMEKQTENARIDSVVEDILVAAATPATTAAAKQAALRKRDAEHEQPDAFRIFQRAARIIRQSTFADGVVFFDTSAAGIGGHSYEDPAPRMGNTSSGSEESQNSSATDFLTGADSAGASGWRRRAREKKAAADASTESKPSSGESAGGGGGGEKVPPTIKSRACPVAGLSLRSNGAASSLTEQDFSFTEASMERYIRRYPYGKFFNFDADGSGINSSDERSEKSETDSDVLRSTLVTTAAATIASVLPGPTAARKPRKRRDMFVPSELLKTLPQVRSLIFLPLWDPVSERWVAGGFIWTNIAGRLMDAEHEFPYLKAFGNSITSEVARSHVQKSDRAKTTFIASISHELRSPLHGILGSVEFLHDTATTAYQSSLVSSIETCGKTLLDTIDHVLDYAKINKLQSANSQRRKNNRSSEEGRNHNKRLPGDNSILGVTTDFNLSQLVEEVCETVCAGHTFRKTHTFHNGAFHDQGGHSRSSSTEVSSMKQGDGGGSGGGGTNPPEDQQHVAVTLNIAPFVNWIVRSQPGAMRRIVMNLLGNALKYTDVGYIVVSLVQESSTSHSVVFKLSIEDSGRGMSAEYQRTKLFAPFSQEDPFSNGTGLGLSIVKQIVDSLKGEIEVCSAVDEGTRITVALRLPGGTSENARTTQRMVQAPEALKRRTASIFFPPGSLGGGATKIGESMEQACYGFSMTTTTVDSFDVAAADPWPDFLITEPASLEKILSKERKAAEGKKAGNNNMLTPKLAVICICTDPTEKGAIESRVGKRVSSHGWALEVVVQPCGPRKLARLLMDIQGRVSPDEITKRPPVLQTKSSYSSSQYLSPDVFQEGNTLAHRSINDITAVEPTEPDVQGTTATTTTTGTGTDAQSPRIAVHAPGLPPSPSLRRSSQVEQQQLRTPDSPSTLNSNSSETASTSSPPRVLLVDDNAINLKLLVVFAKRQDLPYSQAMNGLQAVEEYKRSALAAEPLSSSSSTPPPPIPTPSPSLSPTYSSPLPLHPAPSPSTSPQPLPPPLSPDDDPNKRTTTARRPFDVVLMDLSMPVMDGLEATRQIRAFEGERGIAPRSTVVALTGLASAQDQRDALDAGVDMYLVKPVRFADIKRLFSGP